MSRCDWRNVENSLQRARVLFARTTGVSAILWSLLAEKRAKHSFVSLHNWRYVSFRQALSKILVSSYSARVPDAKHLLISLMKCIMQSLKELDARLHLYCKTKMLHIVKSLLTRAIRVSRAI